MSKIIWSKGKSIPFRFSVIFLITIYLLASGTFVASAGEITSLINLTPSKLKNSVNGIINLNNPSALDTFCKKENNPQICFVENAKTLVSLIGFNFQKAGNYCAKLPNGVFGQNQTPAHFCITGYSDAVFKDSIVKNFLKSKNLPPDKILALCKYEDENLWQTCYQEVSFNLATNNLKGFLNACQGLPKDFLRNQCLVGYYRALILNNTQESGFNLCSNQNGETLILRCLTALSFRYKILNNKICQTNKLCFIRYGEMAMMGKHGNINLALKSCSNDMGLYCQLGVIDAFYHNLYSINYHNVYSYLGYCTTVPLPIKSCEYGSILNLNEEKLAILGEKNILALDSKDQNISKIINFIHLREKEFSSGSPLKAQLSFPELSSIN